MNQLDSSIINNSYIDINALKKEFNVSEFAKSLLPNNETYHEDETETTFFENFLDDIEKQTGINKIEPVPRNFEHLHTWSHIRFKKKQVTSNTENTSKYPEPQSKHYHNGNEVLKKNNPDLNYQEILQEFLEKEKNSKVLFSNLKFNHEPVDLPLIQSAGKKVFRFYYIDAYEKLFGEETAVYLFGKTFCSHCESYKSCCVVVRPLKRRLFLIPRQNETDRNRGNISDRANQMLKEFYAIALKPLNINEFSYRLVKKKTLEGIFLSVEQMVLEIEYSAYYPAVDDRIEGSTFSKVFGSRNNCFDNFLLKKRLKGPCWLDVSNPKRTISAKSWCLFEVSSSTEDISLCASVKSASPPLTLITFHIRSANESNNIALLSWTVNFDYNIWNGNLNSFEEQNYCSISFVHTAEEPLELHNISKTFRRTRIQSMKSEKEMLTCFLSEFNQIDPDIVVVYDIDNKEFHKFVDRLESLKIGDRNKLSKFRVSANNSNLRKFLFNGRLVCDIRHLAKEFDLSKNYELEELYQKFLGISKEQRWLVELQELVTSTGEFSKIVELEDKFLETVVMSTNEALNLMRLALKTNIIPLAVKVTEICGNFLSQTLAGGITKRNEFLLSHAFHQENFIIPKKIFKKKSQQIEEDEILLGGLVLEPKVGFYENYILLMDFQSLYPSIIHEYNLCISHNEMDDLNSTRTHQGVLPMLMMNLIEKRRAVKNKMKNLDSSSTTFFRYQIYQTALKLTANSIYGCLACPYFRFYSPTMAHEITRRARETLEHSVSLLRNQGLQIIYGDTDSMMVNTESKDILYVQKIGENIRNIVNAHYSSIHLQTDTIFKKLLIVAKKKYAGISVDFQKETRILKGLDIIRYDWPEFVCQIGKMVIDITLSDQTLSEKRDKIKEKLEQTKTQLLNNKVPVESLVITKYLSQDPCHYPQKTRHPHVQVALRCNKNSPTFKSGDAVPFVMCCDKRKTSLKQAFHLKELDCLDGWIIDGSYYLNKLFLPFISKICAPIGLCEFEIEKALCSENLSDITQELKIEDITFESRNPFIFNCFKCGELNTIEAYGANTDSQILETCQNSECNYCPIENLNYLKNKLIVTVCSFIKEYYKCELKCTNTKCFFTTLRIPLSYTNENKICPICAKGEISEVFNECDLYLQLEYFKYIFKCGLLSTSEEKKKKSLQSLVDLLCYYENHSGFLSIDLTKLFRDS